MRFAFSLLDVSGIEPVRYLLIRFRGVSKMPITKKRARGSSSGKRSSAAIALRITELKQKILDTDYVDNAVDRIATVVSGKIVERPPMSERSAERFM